MNRVLLGIPTRGIIHTEVIAAVASQFPDVMMTTIAPVSDARNHLVEQFLSYPQFTHLWMLDDDEVPPPMALLSMLSLNKDVVVIDCPSKRTNKSNIFRNDDGTIAASGFGCALFTRRVFEEIPSPWFSLNPRRTLEKNNGNFRFPPIDDAPENTWGGEDINFSLKLTESNLGITEAPGICTHLEVEELQKENRATEILNIRRYESISGSPL